MKIYIHFYLYSLMSIIFEADEIWKELFSIVFLPREAFIWLTFCFVFKKNGDAHLSLLPNKIFPRIFDYLFSFVSCVFLSTSRFPLYAVFNAEQREIRGIGTTLITKLSLTCFIRLYVHVNFFISFRQKPNISFLIFPKINGSKFLKISKKKYKKNINIRKRSKVTKKKNSYSLNLFIF